MTNTIENKYTPDFVSPPGETIEGDNFKLFVNNEFLFVVNKDLDFGNFPIVTKILAEGKVNS